MRHFETNFKVFPGTGIRDAREPSMNINREPVFKKLEKSKHFETNFKTVPGTGIRDVRKPSMNINRKPVFKRMTSAGA